MKFMAWYTKHSFTIYRNALSFDIFYEPIEDHYSEVTRNLISKATLIFLTQIKIV